MAESQSSNYVFPPAFEHLLSASHHAAERAWSAFANFLLAQSILALAWVTIIEKWCETGDLGLTAVLVAMSLAGIVVACQWAMLCTRMWHYDLQYTAQLRRLWVTFTEQKQGPGATAWTTAEGKVRSYWHNGFDTRFFRRWSANQWVLVLVPLIFSLINVVMLGAVAWGVGGRYWTMAVIVGCYLFAVIAVLKVCVPVIREETSP